MKRVRKAVFPVAGLGTRFLPATKAQPKEMLPVVDKPLIQYAVEEAVAAGITDMVFITGRNKRAIEDHFDSANELELELESGGKTELLEILRESVPKGIHCIYMRQPAPLGLGHAVLCARPVIGDEPFAVLLADDLMDVDAGKTPVLGQMLDAYAVEGASILAVQDVPREETRQYGIVSSHPYKERLELVDGIVEKPAPEQAPSTLGVVGRYVLNASIFDQLELIGKGAGGEIQLTDGIARLMQQERIMAYRFDGRRFDCGSKLGYLKATVAMALKHPEMGQEFARYLEQSK
ncbi:UTP--glucose-1-phosphate uridylyltransferase GalU [Noviherbaspirillum denitrificans]|uniref:UTP--glucose-1-phosphate uridylyltransferase n=1 Tax=Noviherbaspirillum denitrificans TaxID=1968433 RepID=A0A254TJ07_9BURK|nr:UTP--glucose-1-phosphate uridylyltransferase GalU [Noviherbaspirillum denitrificans]OWW22197.1 UTP--glucose-1-phosphate uridylyltransferase [Noviherbaspirillum denitrificans]